MYQGAWEEAAFRVEGSFLAEGEYQHLLLAGMDLQRNIQQIHSIVPATKLET